MIFNGAKIGMFLILVMLVFSTFSNAEAKNKRKEKEYQKEWCDKNKGRTEVRLSDMTRVDCLTKTHAIEFDFGKKWHEAIGQSLGYAIETNKRAGIVLILEKPKHYKHWIKLNSVIMHYKLPIDTWKIVNY